MKKILGLTTNHHKGAFDGALYIRDFDITDEELQQMAEHFIEEVRQGILDARDYLDWKKEQK